MYARKGVCGSHKKMNTGRMSGLHQGSGRRHHRATNLSSSPTPDQKPSGPNIAAKWPHLRLPVTLRAMRHRNFQLFFGGQLISLIGTWMQNVAQAWLVYRLTGSSLLLGSVTFA